MLGKIKTDELKSAIISRVGISDVVAGKLITEINEKISKELREKLMSQAMPRTAEMKDSKILESAGIQIIGEGQKVPPPPITPPVTTPKPDLTELELPAPAPSTLGIANAGGPVLSQKFTGSFKMDTVKTEIAPEALTKKEAVKPKNYEKGADPYRELPQ
jgi:hypothetical protein